MPKSITRDQINTINAKMSNGFRLHLDCWGEKQAAKSIQIDERNTLVATLTWRDSYESKTTAYRQTINVPNGMHHIALHLAVWYTKEESGVSVSDSLGKWIDVGPDSKHRSFAAIQKLTAKYDDAAILALYDAIRHKASIPRI